MTSAPPPLPDHRALIAASPWVAGRSWLPEEAAIWQRELPPVRKRLEREAALLARPRVWIDTVATLATTGWRMAGTAPLEILTAAAGAFGLPVGVGGDESSGGVAAAEQLVRAGGPAYVKLGQFIASADGLLPPAWVEAFGWCRDRVPAFDGAPARIRAELGERFDELLDLEPEPFAAASIGQVHRARLKDGTDVVVKVRRPELRARFARDIEALALVAAAAHRASATARVANLPGFVELFSELSLLELDFRLEALNMVELGACFEDAGFIGPPDGAVPIICGPDAHRGTLNIPRPIPGMVTERVLVMEALPGEPYDRWAGGDGSDGDRLVELAIKGVLEGTLAYGRFHGDLHAGNVLVDGGSRFSLVDFGITGRLNADERAGLVRFLLGFAAMDAAKQLVALEAFGAPPATPQMVADLQQVIDALPPGLTVDALGETLGGVVTTLAAHGFQVPTQLVLFFKNVLYLSSFTAAVAPEADLLAQIGPQMAYFMTKYGDDLLSMA